MRPSQQKKERKGKEHPRAWPPFRGPSEVGLLQRRPLGLAEQPPGRRRDFFAKRQVELLALRGTDWGAASRAGGRVVAEWQGRILGQGVSGGGFRAGEAQAAAAFGAFCGPTSPS